MDDALVEEMRRDLTRALKARDVVTVRALRTTLAAIANAGAVSVSTPPPRPGGSLIAGATGGLGATELPRRDLNDDDVRAIVITERDSRRAAAEQYAAAGKPDEAATLRDQADALDRYLGRR